MTATTETLEREAKLQGMGVSRLRKEDARFIRGKGSYVDDIKLPGMLFGAIVAAPTPMRASNRSTNPRRSPSPESLRCSSPTT